MDSQEDELAETDDEDEPTEWFWLYMALPIFCSLIVLLVFWLIDGGYQQIRDTLHGIFPPPPELTNVPPFLKIAMDILPVFLGFSIALWILKAIANSFGK